MKYLKLIILAVIEVLVDIYLSYKKMHKANTC